MTEDQLGRILRDMYDNAPRGDQAAMIHLFGVKYAHEIQTGGLTATAIVRASGIKESYKTEVSKGVRLARYVVPKS